MRDYSKIVAFYYMLCNNVTKLRGKSTHAAVYRTRLPGMSHADVT